MSEHGDIDPTTGPSGGPGSQLRCPDREHDWLPRLPKRLAWFEPAFLALAAQYISDLGGEHEMTAGRKILLRETLVAWINVTRQGRSLQVRGVGKRNGDPSPMLASYYTGLNTLRLNLLALGLGRRARDVQTLGAYLAQRRPATPAGADGANGDGAGPDPADHGDRPAAPEGRRGTGPRGTEPDV